MQLPCRVVNLVLYVLLVRASTKTLEPIAVRATMALRLEAARYPLSVLLQLHSCNYDQRSPLIRAMVARFTRELSPWWVGLAISSSPS